MDKTFQLTVNGRRHVITTDPDRPLLDVLREDLDLSGTKYACGEGRCGACSVLVGSRRIRACVTPVSKVDGKMITTIEGLAQGEVLHPVQEAFIEEGALQCGYCTSGMIITATALLAANPRPTDHQILAAMNGNICRCNGYQKIFNAIRRAARKMKDRQQ